MTMLPQTILSPLPMPAPLSAPVAVSEPLPWMVSVEPAGPACMPAQPPFDELTLFVPTRVMVADPWQTMPAWALLLRARSLSVTLAPSAIDICEAPP